MATTISDVDVSYPRGDSFFPRTVYLSKALGTSEATAQTTITVTEDVTPYTELSVWARKGSGGSNEWGFVGDYGVKGEHDHSFYPTHQAADLSTTPDSQGRMASEEVITVTPSLATAIEDSVSEETDSNGDPLQADSITSIKIFDDAGNEIGDVYSGSDESGVSEEKDIDITQYVDGPGWYDIEITPESITFLKARIFLDHVKETEG